MVNRMSLNKAVKAGRLERKIVIHTVEQCHGVHLKKVGSRQKWLQDEKGNNWWVLVGTGSWHGIPDDMIKAECQDQTEGKLVVGVCGHTGIKVFSISLKPIIEAKDKLYLVRLANGYQCQFNCEDKGTHMLIKEIPGLSMEYLDAVPFNRQIEEAVWELDKIFKTLKTDEGREEFIAMLKKNAQDRKLGNSEI